MRSAHQIDAALRRRAATTLTVLPPSPLAPFDAWPIQIADQEASLYAWYVAPNVFVFQYHEPIYGLLTAQKVVLYTDSAREACHAAMAANKGMVVIHDLRLVTRVAPEGQKYLKIAWKKLTGPEVNAVYLVVGSVMPSLLRATINFINVVAALTTGKTMSFVADFSEPFAKHAVPPPAPGVEFPGAALRRG